MRRLFTLAIFLSATLLFMVQPLVAKMLLPVLGGSPEVWSTCLVFFQTVLLLGYLYAHALSTWVPGRWQKPLHVLILIAASLMLPLPVEIGEPGSADPRGWLLRSLAVSVGLPFFVLATTAPLLQQWFSRTDDPKAADPYFLYSASNAGSLFGLIGFLLLEMAASRSSLLTGWAAGFWIVAALIAASAYAVGVGLPSEARSAKEGRVGIVGQRSQNLGTGTGTGTGIRNPRTRTQNPAPRTENRIFWVLLAAIPSALLLGVTQHLTTDVVSIPLLWVVPLALYLGTYIAAFAKSGFGTSERWGTIAAIAALLVLVLALAEVRYPILPVALVHLSAFTALAMMCHVRLAETRPAPAHLTRYYLCISLGGVLGGAAVALLAPAVFPSVLEYPLAIAAALLLRPQTARADRTAPSSSMRWALRAGAVVLLIAGVWVVSTFTEASNLVRASFAVPAVLMLVTPRAAMLLAGAAAGLLVAAGGVRTGGDAIYRERTFFGVHEVTSQQNGDWHVLTHGTTTHGVQAFRGKLRFIPTAYYHPTGPIGDIVFTLSGEKRLQDVAVVGLGAGALAGYAGSNVRMDFFEIDDAVIRIAENPNYFTYLTDARARTGATIRTLAVDGRLGMRSMPAASYDLIVVDAFSSDAIPTHLITREAVAMFVSRLKPRGVVAFHVSNRFFNLGPVLARLGDDQGLVSFVRNDNDVPPERAAEAKRPSVWVVLAREAADLGQIARLAPRWVRLMGTSARVWTDDYTNVLGALED